MPGLSFKPDASFFEYIAIGAIGARAAAADLEERGHSIAELENGSTGTKLWKEVKRKRVRIPDLVCTGCGLRVESRTKSRPDLSMSHSPTDAERAWDFGLVDDDVIAFPACERQNEEIWNRGRLRDQTSFWHDRERVRWQASDYVNYFRVGDFRAHEPARSATKGVAEASETTISWDAIFSTRDGEVTAVDDDDRITVRRASDGHVYTWQNDNDLRPTVREGDTVVEHQVLASAVPPADDEELTCPRSLSEARLRSFLGSPERTQRFTGVKLARLRGEDGCAERVREIAGHPEEDLYVRLEAAIYLTSVCDAPAREVIGPYLDDTDDQIRLEGVVALAEAATPGATELLAALLDDQDEPYFLRSASAWALGRIGSGAAVERLTRAFEDVDMAVREEALEALAEIGPPALPELVDSVVEGEGARAAGAAEALRRFQELPDEAIEALREAAAGGDVWPVWLLGHLHADGDAVEAAIAALQEENPRAHYAVSVIWTFLRSWIAEYWEPRPVPSTDS